MAGRMSAKAIDYWTFFAGDARRTGSPLYARLAEGIGSDAELKVLAARARVGQPHANMILGAVHFLLLRGADHPLKRFYGTLGGTATVENEDPFPDFRDFVLSHHRGAGKGAAVVGRTRPQCWFEHDLGSLWRALSQEWRPRGEGE